jgi:hypothetical protein
LITVNHGLLCTLGVGHPALSAAVDAVNAVGFSAKLTGAGGGGCAIALIPSNAHITEPIYKHHLAKVISVPMVNKNHDIIIEEKKNCSSSQSGAVDERFVNLMDTLRYNMKRIIL